MWLPNFWTKSWGRSFPTVSETMEFFPRLFLRGRWILVKFVDVLHSFDSETIDLWSLRRKRLNRGLGTSMPSLPTGPKYFWKIFFLNSNWILMATLIDQHLYPGQTDHLVVALCLVWNRIGNIVKCVLKFCKFTICCQLTLPFIEFLISLWFSDKYSVPIKWCN